MSPNPITVYMCDNVFYESFDNLITDIQKNYGKTITYSEYLDEIPNRCDEVAYFDPGAERDIYNSFKEKGLIIIPTTFETDDNIICIYEFNDIKNVRFMICNGPDEDCIFIIPEITKKKCFKIANGYFNHYKNAFIDNDINVVISLDEINNVMHIYDENDYDNTLMRFTYIEPKLY